MADHVHVWTPILGMAGRYECPCSATGYRAFSGQIVEHKHKLSRERALDCRPEREGGGRIPPKPTTRD
jgi:putative component of membrane protein insertase Oxa1/YidC/SpoIIIJ protein YidD